MSSSPKTSKASSGLAVNIVITELPSLNPVKKGTRPAHHVDDSRRKFRNPWESYRSPTKKQAVGFFLKNLLSSPAIPRPEVLSKLIPTQTPTWGEEPEHATKLKATWLGHAAFLVELPTPPGAARGPRVLLDPALSPRCSSAPWGRRTRFTNVPCAVLDVPPIDVIVISHNHHDHLDAPTLRALRQRDNPHLFCPLGSEPLLADLQLAFTKERRHVLDWWDARAVAVYLPAEKPGAAPVHTTFRLTCTPAQHASGRGMFDKGRALWASWALQGEGPGAAVFFAGDTGYRTVLNGEDEDAVPVCHVFKEIGERIGGFDLALLPIGGYAPRGKWSGLNSSPGDSIRIFQDIKAKRGLAMHWGTWALTTEPVTEPPEKLKEACEKAGWAPDLFDVCGLGETRVF